MEPRSTMTKSRGKLNNEIYSNRISLANGERNQGVKGVVNNYSIVASRGELTRNNCATQKKSKTVGNSGNARANQRDHYVEKELSRSVAGSTDFKSPRPIRKSFSVPDCLREDQKTSEESLLKKSSAFLSSLAHPNKIRERKLNDGCTRGILSANDYCARRTCSTLKDYIAALSGDFDPLLRRSPSAQTLSVERQERTGARVKKSVSFSSDTSFEKRASYGRAAVHEVKVYHKGVLQDRSEINIATKVPSSEGISKGRWALLEAARDADDAALNEIAGRIRKFGLGNVDVNVADSSGRTAISYLAGSGATAMLELALSFDGVDPNIPDNEGNTPLHFAAQAGQTECLNVLLQRCTDIELDARNVSGFTPLMKAALQGRTKCAKILLFAGANPTLRDHGRGLRAEQWARFCGRYVCAEVIERFARHRLLERSTSCRWGSEPELAAKVLQGKVMPIPTSPLVPPSSGFKSKIKKVFRTTSGPDRNFSLVSQLTSAALCASSPALPKSSEVPPVVKSLLRPLSVPQLRVTLVASGDLLESKEKYGTNFTEKIENSVVKSRSKKKK
ncbi:ankyrin repeat domain-containing protein 33B-like [Ceratina calcarata]|uniref:Ankyrin repeat domain-containing protein 33B-like n=1 Tax=Ceratina calcarata TaxID=156304 RepID=A0AAJ7JAB8_9HYME|nr:ankyrin repeat domain-containing protein 33B-like [Ceratina calcarata]